MVVLVLLRMLLLDTRHPASQLLQQVVVAGRRCGRVLVGVGARFCAVW